MPGFLSKLLYGGTKRGTDTVVEVKRVEDIPPIIEASRILLTQNYRRAITVMFKAMRNDYARFFRTKIPAGVTNRQFIIEGYKDFGIVLDESAYTDNYYLVDAVAAPPPINEGKINQYNALRKLTYFYLDYFEPSTFSVIPIENPDKIMERVSEFYSFMNIVKLYFEEEA